jgi:hypothetical protein
VEVQAIGQVRGPYAANRLASHWFRRGCSRSSPCHVYPLSRVILLWWTRVRSQLFSTPRKRHPSRRLPASGARLHPWTLAPCPWWRIRGSGERTKPPASDVANARGSAWRPTSSPGSLRLFWCHQRSEVLDLPRVLTTPLVRSSARPRW